MTIVYNIFANLARLLGDVFFARRVVHPERMIEDGPLIIAVNHSSFVDPPLAGICSRRAVYYLARADLLEWPFFGPLFPDMNVIPVERDGNDMSALREVIKKIRDGNGVVLFPEGTRSKDGNLQPARAGIGLVIAKTLAPVLPMRIFGAYEAFPRDSKIPRCRPITVVIGKPIHFTREDVEPTTRDTYQQLSDRVMKAIGELTIDGQSGRPLPFFRMPAPRVVLDTDTFNEVDDQFALAHLLLSDLRLEAIYAAPFQNTRSTGPGDGMEKSFEEIHRLLDLIRPTPAPPVFRGSRRFLSHPHEPVESEAVADLIERAMAPSPEKLHVVAIAAATNIASALLLEPRIAERITLVWLGGHAPFLSDTREFNLEQDIHAARILLDGAVPLVLLPCYPVCSHLKTTVSELEALLAPRGPLGAYLTQIVRQYAPPEPAWSKVIWDIGASAWMVNPEWVPTIKIPSPVLRDDLTWELPTPAGRRMIDMAILVQRDRIFADFFAKAGTVKQATRESRRSRRAIRPRLVRSFRARLRRPLGVSCPAMSSIGQLLLVGVPGAELDAESAAFYKKLQPGGFILFGRNIQTPRQLRKLIDDLRDLNAVEPIITIDQEGGRVSRLKLIGNEPPNAQQLRDRGDRDLIRRHGDITGRLLRLFGFNLDLCPVLDISFDDEADNSLKGRCYGRTVAEVIEKAGAFNDGLRATGVQSCGKHFPGYSSAGLDPHHELPSLERSRELMEEYELAVFRHFADKVDSMMIGHITISGLEAGGPPASLSPALIDGLLRREMGFDGLVMTDDLDMGAILNHYGFDETMRMGLAAGNDLLMICHRVELAAQAKQVLEALPAEAVDPALRRLATFKRKLVPPDAFSEDAFRAVDAEIWDLRVATLGAERAARRSAEDGKRSPVELY